MTDSHQSKGIVGNICRRCGQFFASGSVCPTCGDPSSALSGDEISISVHFSVLICQSCQHVMSIGTPSCPVYGDVPSADEPSDPRDGPINRAKLRALGDLLPRYRYTVKWPSSPPEPETTLTDEQFFAFFKRNDLISERLIGDIGAALDRVDVSSKVAIRSAETRRAVEELLAGAEAIRSVYDDAAAVRVPDQFSELHLLLLSIYRGLLDLRLACAEAVLAITIEEAQVAQQTMQQSLDRVAIVAKTMADEIELVDPEAVVFDQVNRRLEAFVGKAQRYEHAGQPDLAAALSAGVGEPGDFTRLGALGTAFFGRMLPLDPTLLPQDQGIVLYALAAEVSALEDPLTVRRRTSVLLGLYNEAYRLDPASMTSSLIASERDAEVAANHMLSLGDRVRIPRQEELPLEAARQEMASVYVTLTEWIYRRLLNLPLAAKYVVQGQPRLYAEVSDSDFGAKVNELSQTSDPRYASALLGVSTIARNAGAHGDIDTSGTEIVLRKRDKKGRIEVERMIDEDFIARLQNLALTCRALLLASALFRIQHHQQLPPPSPVAHRRLAAETARTIVGLFGLVRAKVQFEEESRVAVDADEDEARAGREARGYLAAAFTLAVLFPDSSEIDLRVFRAGIPKCRIQVPIADVITHQSVSKHAATYSFLKLSYLSTIEGDDKSEPARIIREIIRPGSRLLKLDLNELLALRQRLPDSRAEFMTSLEEMAETLSIMSAALTDLSLPQAAIGPSDSLRAGMDALARGLRHHHQLAECGRWTALKQQNNQLQRGETIVERWRQ